MNIAPCAKLSTPRVPRMIVRPLATSASSEPRASPLNAWESSSGSDGIALFVCCLGGFTCTGESPRLVGGGNGGAGVDLHLLIVKAMAANTAAKGGRKK